jgi:hypothetical protein
MRRVRSLLVAVVPAAVAALVAVSGTQAVAAPLPAAPLPAAPLPAAPLPAAPLPAAPLPSAPLPAAPLPGAGGPPAPEEPAAADQQPAADGQPAADEPPAADESPAADEPAPASPAFPAEEFTLKNVRSHQCLGSAGAVRGSRSHALALADCDGRRAKKWTYDPVSKRMRTKALGEQWCLSATEPAMLRCPDLRSDTFRWNRDDRDRVWTPSGADRLYLGVVPGPDGVDQVVVSKPGADGGSDWVIAPVEPPQPAGA